jgi:hypothetical protein
MQPKWRSTFHKQLFTVVPTTSETVTVTPPELPAGIYRVAFVSDTNCSGNLSTEIEWYPIVAAGQTTPRATQLPGGIWQAHTSFPLPNMLFSPGEAGSYGFATIGAFDDPDATSCSCVQDIPLPYGIIVVLTKNIGIVGRKCEIEMIATKVGSI